MAVNWIWPNFSEKEMSCRCCGKAEMDPAFMDKLQGLRDLLGEPLRVNSGYRCREYNKKIGGGPAHPKGMAVDLGINRKLAYNTLVLALAMGFQGVGIKQKGKGRFIHLDMLPGSSRAPRPTVWSY